MESNILQQIGEKSVEVPESVQLHPHLTKTFKKSRLKRVAEGLQIDWATAEAMAIGSLLLEGVYIQLVSNAFNG